MFFSKFVTVTTPAMRMHRGLRTCTLCIHHPCNHPFMRMPGGLRDLHIIFLHHHCYYPCHEGSERLWWLACYFCIIPVTTPARRMPKSFWDLHIICASSLLPPLQGGCLEVSGTCNLFLHLPCYHPCQGHLQGGIWKQPASIWAQGGGGICM